MPDCKSGDYVLGSSNLSLPTKLTLSVLKPKGIIFLFLLVSCSTPKIEWHPATDTRTAGHPLKIMYPWLVGGKSKTKKYDFSAYNLLLEKDNGTV